MSEHLTITDRARDRAEYLGLAQSHEARERVLSMMAYNAATTTHRRGNYRYGDFVLKMNGNTLHDIYVDSMRKGFCGECFGALRLVVPEICETCEARGCDECGDQGEVARTIACPECN